MVFSVHITTSAKKAVKKLPPKVRDEVIRIAKEDIAAHPFDADKLKGPLSNVRSFHFKYSGTDYRIAYRVNEDTGRIDVLLIGTRENFYERLRQAMQK